MGQYLHNLIFSKTSLESIINGQLNVLAKKSRI